MSVPSIQVDHVWKKFRKGEMHDSLRELIPAVAKRLVGRSPKRDDLGNREFWALQDVSFEVKRGESVGIIGPNGAGKSTMLKMLSRIIKPNRGSYRVNGRLSALIEVGAGFHQDLTGRENIYLNGTIIGMSRKEIRSKEQQIIDFAGVEEFIETPVKRYSSGMKARLGFAVAAHMEPDILLVDEVLSVGDAKFRQKCLRHMRSLIESDVTVVFISHLLDQVRSLCPNTIVLDHGQVIYKGPTDGAIRKYLDALGDDNDGKVAGHYTDVDVSDIRLRDSEGKEVLELPSRQPAVITFDLTLHRPLQAARVLINISDLGGTYIGTVNSKAHGLVIPETPGKYHMRFTMDPMPLADGDFAFRMTVMAGEGQPVCVWAAPQPRVISVRGSDTAGGVILCDGSWEITESAPSSVVA